MAEEMGLADFLADLRAELVEAQRRAEGEAMKLGVDEVEVSLDVAYTREETGEVGGQVKASFWVLGVEAGAKGSRTTEHARTQHLKLTLKPRLEESVPGDLTRSRGVSVQGRLEATEENPELPLAPAATPD